MIHSVFELGDTRAREWIDTGQQPDAQTQQLAARMGASYLPMPQVQAQRMAHAMDSLRSPV